MKLCKDCMHVEYYGYTRYPMCVHPKAPIDPVTGENNGSCSLMRSRNCLIEQCGVNGDWFEEMPPRPHAIEPASLSSMACADMPKRPFWRRIFG